MKDWIFYWTAEEAGAERTEQFNPVALMQILHNLSAAADNLIDNFDKFKKGYRNYLSGNKSLFDFEKTLATLSATTDLDIDEDIFSWENTQLAWKFC